MNSIDPTCARSAANSKEGLLIEAIQEYQTALDSSEPPNREAFLRKYSSVAGDLADCLDNLDFLENIAPQSAPTDQRIATGTAASTGAIYSQLGDFRIVREVGRGGMGVVYEAEQTSMSRRVALKVLPFAAILDQKILQRFRSEAQIAGQLIHQNIVPVYSVGCERNVHYYAMQFIDGLTLAELIQQLKDAAPQQGETAVGGQSSLASQSEPEVRTNERETRTFAKLSTTHSKVDPHHIRSNALLMAQVALALDYAHGQGVIHRDIKPSNLMVDGEGKIWVTDFGLAHVEKGPSITITGDFLGTLRYMSPEQALSQRVVVDHRTDIYSLGLTFFELFTHQPAFSGTDRQELLRQISFEEPIRPRRLNSAIPIDLETILLKAIEKNPADRYQTTAELAADLQRFADDRPIHARRPTLVQKTNKWCRRHRSLVATVLAAGFILVSLAAVGSSLLAVRLNEVAQQEKELGDKERMVNAELKTANDNYVRVLARSYVDKAQALCEDGEIATGMLWLARALNTAPADAFELQRAIRSSLSAWHLRLPSLRLMTQQDEPIHAVALSGDGRRLFTGGSSGTLRVLDALSGHALAISSCYQTPAPILAIALSPHGKCIATTSEDGTTRIWNAQTLLPMGPPIEFPEDDVSWRGRDVRFSSDGTQVISGAEYGFYQGGQRNFRGQAMVWEIRSQRLLNTSELPGGVLRLRDTPQGMLAALRIDQQTCQLWNLDTNQAASPPLVQPGQWISCLAISPDGTRLGSAGFVTIEVWAADTGKLINRFGSSGNIYSLDFNKTGTQILSAGLDQAARLWDVESGTSATMPLRHLAPVRTAAFSADYTQVVSGTGSGGLGAANGTVRVWDVAMQRPTSRPLQADGIRSVTFTRQGLRVLTSTEEAQHLYQLRDGENLVPVGQSFRTSGSIPNMGMKFSADGSRFAICAGGSALEVRNAGTCERMARMPVANRLTSMAFSPNSRYLVTGDNYGHVTMWEADSLQQLGEVFLPDSISGLEFSGDGKYFVTGCFDGTVQLWDAVSCKEVGDPIRHVSEVKCLAYHPLKNQVFVGCADGSARLWDLQTRTPMGPSVQHKNFLCDVVYSPDGTQVVSVSTDGKICFWDSTTLQPVGPPLTHRRSGPQVSFSPDGRQIVADQRFMAEMWDLSLTPLSGTTDDIRRWTELVTGWSVDEMGQVHGLGTKKWAKQRNELIGKQLQLPGLPEFDEYSDNDARRRPPMRVLAERALRNAAWQTAISHIDRAMDETPPRWMDYVIRGRALTATDLMSAAEQAFELALQTAPDDFTRATVRMERLRSYLTANRGDDAAATLAEPISSRTDSSLSWIMTDWYTSGPYPGQLIESDLFDHDAGTPSQTGTSVHSKQNAIGLPWRPRPTLKEFAADEGRILSLPAVGPSATYALAYVYSTDERDVTLFLGYDDGARIWWNGQRICSSEFAFGQLTDQDLRSVTLRRGWNTLVAKVSNDGGLNTKLYTRISVDTVDHAFASSVALGEAGHWTEAGRRLTEACRMCDDVQTKSRRLISVARRLKQLGGIGEKSRLGRLSGNELATQALNILENSSAPDDPAGFLFLSLIHRELGNTEQAARCYQRALACAETLDAGAADEFERFRDFAGDLLQGVVSEDRPR